MTEKSEADDYQFQHQIGMIRLKLGVHASNSSYKPRIRWSIENTGLKGDEATVRVPPDRSDFWMPYATLDVAEPRLVFGRNENPRPAIKPESRTIDAEARDTISLPHQLASDLRERLEALGSVADDDQLCADPSAFPTVIQSSETDPVSTEWEAVGWEPARKVMWYADRKTDSRERSYQIEDGNLIWRRFDRKNPESATREPISGESFQTS